MHKLIIGLLMGCFLTGPVFAQSATTLVSPEAQIAVQRRKEFKERRKLIKKLVKQYKKAPEEEKATVKAQLEQVVSDGVDAGITYVKERLAADRARLERWEEKVKADEANLAQVKAQRVEDLLTGEAGKKHRQAKKNWKQQLRAQKKAK